MKNKMEPLCDTFRKQKIPILNDQQLFASMSGAAAVSITSVQSLDYLLERDKQREKDGFPRKIRVGKMVKPSQNGDDKIVIVPTTVEEKLIHDQVRVTEEGEDEGDDTGGGEGGGGGKPFAGLEVSFQSHQGLGLGFRFRLSI